MSTRRPGQVVGVVIVVVDARIPPPSSRVVDGGGRGRGLPGPRRWDGRQRLRHPQQAVMTREQPARRPVLLCGHGLWRAGAAVAIFFGGGRGATLTNARSGHACFYFSAAGRARRTRRSDFSIPGCRRLCCTQGSRAGESAWALHRRVSPPPPPPLICTCVLVLHTLIPSSHPAHNKKETHTTKKRCSPRPPAPPPGGRRRPSPLRAACRRPRCRTCRTTTGEWVEGGAFARFGAIGFFLPLVAASRAADLARRTRTRVEGRVQMGVREFVWEVVDRPVRAGLVFFFFV